MYMISVKDIPEDWKLIREMVSVIFGKCILAGGALRDLDHGRPVKDVDLFVPTEDMTDLNVLMQRLADDYGVTITQTFNGSFEGTTNDEVVGCYTFMWRGHEVQIIGLHFPFQFGDEPFDFHAATVNRLDIGLCRISFDGVWLHRDWSYLHDSFEKVLTTRYAPSEEALSRSVRRAERLQEKYVGWPHQDLTERVTTHGCLH